MTNIDKSKSTVRERLNEKVFNLGSLKISFVHLVFLIIINTSMVCILINFFVKGGGVFEWWSVLVATFLIFSYLILRIFTSSGIMLGRQVTFLITLFNLFLNLMKIFGMVKSNQHWELTFLIPLVNLLCLAFLVFVFAVRKKKFRTIIIPSLKIALVSIIPIVRLYFLLGRNYILPIFNYVVLVLAFALFINSLFLNWLNILRITEQNIEMLKKGATEFQKASKKVATVNKKIDSLNVGFNKVKSFFSTSGAAFKEFFTFSKKKKNISNDTDNALPARQTDIAENILLKKVNPKKSNIIKRAYLAALKKVSPKKQKEKDSELALCDQDNDADAKG